MSASRKPRGKAETEAASPPSKSPGPHAAPGLDLDVLPSLMGFHMRLAGLEIYRDFAGKMASLRLTQKQAAVLILIGANPGISQIAMAKFLGTDRATMMAMVNRLQAAHLIERTASETDRRRSALELTEMGIATLEELKHRLARHEKRFTDRFTGSELAQFTEFLSRVHKKL